MKYIEILNAKIEALETAKINLQAALLVCEDQEASFDNVEVFSDFNQAEDTKSFNKMASILVDRRLTVSRQLGALESLLLKAKEEMSLVEWSI